MIKPEFKDMYVTKFIIENGKCYTIKKEKLDKVNDYQKVVFAIELKNKFLMVLKDLSIGSNLSLETTKKKGFIDVAENMVVTTSADTFSSLDSFLSFYEETDIIIEEFISEYQTENLENSLKTKNINKPKKRSS